MSKLIDHQQSNFLGIGKKSKGKRAAKKAAVKPSAESKDFVQVLKPVTPGANLETIKLPVSTDLSTEIKSPVYTNVLGNITGGTGSKGELYRGDTSENIEPVEVVGIRRKVKKDNTLVYLIAGLAALVIIVMMFKKK